MLVRAFLTYGYRQMLTVAAVSIVALMCNGSQNHAEATSLGASLESGPADTFSGELELLSGSDRLALAGLTHTTPSAPFGAPWPNGGPISATTLDHFKKGSAGDLGYHTDGDEAMLTVAAIMVALNPDGKIAWTDKDLAGVIESEAGAYRVTVREEGCGAHQSGCHAYPNPIPATVWLLATALLGLLGIGMRQRRAQVAPISE